MVHERDLAEINGLIAKREWIKKQDGPLTKAHHSMLYFIRFRLEELGVVRVEAPAEEEDGA